MEDFFHINCTAEIWGSLCCVSCVSQPFVWCYSPALLKCWQFAYYFLGCYRYPVSVTLEKCSYSALNKVSIPLVCCWFPERCAIDSGSIILGSAYFWISSSVTIGVEMETFCDFIRLCLYSEITNSPLRPLTAPQCVIEWNCRWPCRTRKQSDSNFFTPLTADTTSKELFKMLRGFRLHKQFFFFFLFLVDIKFEFERPWIMFSC